MKLIFLFILVLPFSTFSEEILQKDNIGFNFSVDSTRGPSYSVSIIENHLLVVNSFGENSIPVSWCSEDVSANLLDDIHIKLKSLGVYQWKRFYVVPDGTTVRDGSDFKLSFNYNNVKLFIWGDNNFPKNYDQLVKYVEYIVEESACEYYFISR